MPDLDDSAASAAGRAPSRRSVLKGVAGAGAAGVAATAMAGIAVPASAATKASAAAKAPAAHETPLSADEAAGDDVVVHVRDAGSGEIDVYRGTSHTKLRDRDLAARLVRASK